MKSNVLQSFKTELEKSPLIKEGTVLSSVVGSANKIGKNLATAGKASVGMGAMLGTIGVGSAIGATALPKDV